MRSVKSMIDELQKFPEDAMCYAYEGEVTGLVIIKPNSGSLKQDANLGVIWATESKEEDAKVEDYRDGKFCISTALCEEVYRLKDGRLFEFRYVSDRFNRVILVVLEGVGDAYLNPAQYRGAELCPELRLHAKSQ
jgi:hypothetical protein